jgi:hypothetical protein
VDHPAHSPEPIQLWRMATLVATAIAGLELVLLIVAGIILVGKSIAPQVHEAAVRQATAQPAAVKPAATKPAFRPPKVAPILPRGRTGVLVLNGNGVQGAASEAAALVKARGYLVKQFGNAPQTGYARTMIMYKPGFRGEAVRFRRDLNIGVVTALDGMKPAQLHGAKLVLVLGAAR